MLRRDEDPDHGKTWIARCSPIEASGVGLRRQ